MKGNPDQFLPVHANQWKTVFRPAQSHITAYSKTALCVIGQRSEYNEVVIQYNGSLGDFKEENFANFHS